MRSIVNDPAAPDVGKTHSIVVEKILPHSAPKVWRILTDSALVSKWLMPNDLVAKVGHAFTFKTRPMGDWDGVVHCKVLICDPPHMLVYSWRGGSDGNGARDEVLDSVVSWILTPTADGTLVRMEHSGFRLPNNQLAFDAMSPGWNHVLDRIAGIIEANGT